MPPPGSRAVAAMVTAPDMPSGPVNVNALSPVPATELQPSGTMTTNLGRGRVGHFSHGHAATAGGGGTQVDAAGGMWSAGVVSTPGTGSAGSKDGVVAVPLARLRFRRWSSRSPQPLPRRSAKPCREPRTAIFSAAQSREKASASSLSRSSYGLPEMSTVTSAMVPPVNRNGAL
jgi:hypothetical protein